MFVFFKFYSEIRYWDIFCTKLGIKRGILFSTCVTTIKAVNMFYFILQNTVFLILSHFYWCKISAYVVCNSSYIIVLFTSHSFMFRSRVLIIWFFCILHRLLRILELWIYDILHSMHLLVELAHCDGAEGMRLTSFSVYYICHLSDVCSFLQLRDNISTAIKQSYQEL